MNTHPFQSSPIVISKQVHLKAMLFYTSFSTLLLCNVNLNIVDFNFKFTLRQLKTEIKNKY